MLELLADQSSGPREATSVKRGWLFFIIIGVNELRGMFAAWEGAQAMGWV